MFIGFLIRGEGLGCFIAFGTGWAEGLVGSGPNGNSTYLGHRPSWCMYSHISHAPPVACCHCVPVLDPRLNE